MPNSVKAVSLVVMSTNTTAIPGEKVFTIGIQINQSDLTAPGTGPNPPLFAQNVTFVASANGPFQQSGASNEPDIQSVQTDFINPAAVGGPPGSLGVAGDDVLYRDSWWYSSGTIVSGSMINSITLQGVVDKLGDIGTVTTNPASDGSGVYTTGPTANVGSTGYLFASVPPPANPTNGQSMVYDGIFGPPGMDYLDHPPLSTLFINGKLTVPLAQIVASGNITIPSQWQGGNGTFISIGQDPYNVLGGPNTTDPGAILDYANNVIRPIPEPTSLLLAGLGAFGMAVAVKRRRRSSG